MLYKELTFTIESGENYHKDLLINDLAEIGFNTFEDCEGGFKAYIPSSDLDSRQLTALLEVFSKRALFSYKVNDIPHENWNQVWESNFRPLIINERCYVRATFHEAQPQYEFEIVIDPKMAFGTGHHQTTALMMELMMEEDFRDKKVLDMGCGTGILAILASRLEAKEIYAGDYDQICFESTLENAALNGVRNINAFLGSKEAIPDQKYDIILANINRNILLDQIARYYEMMRPGSVLYLSGFYENPDLNIIQQKAEECGFTYGGHKKLDDWVAARFLYKS